MTRVRKSGAGMGAAMTVTVEFQLRRDMTRLCEIMFGAASANRHMAVEKNAEKCCKIILLNCLKIREE